MKEYPEGDDRFWAVIEYGFAAFCAASVAVCLAIAFGGVG